MFTIESNAVNIGLKFTNRANMTPQIQRDIIRDVGIEIISLMLRNPNNRGAAKDTGTMRRSISPTPRMVGDEAHIYIGVYYWIYVAFGTYKMAPRPFHRWAVEDFINSGKLAAIQHKHIRRLVSG